MNHPFPALVEITRGALVESVLHGAAAVVDATGQMIAAAGSPDTVSFLRSTSKPLQALPLVEAGGVEAYCLNQEELAVMCASHSGSDEHVRVVSAMQARIGLTETMLLCGTDLPVDKAFRQRMLCAGELPTPNRHNCSGKHTGFLAYAKLRGEPLADYINPDHPIQQTILRVVAEMAGLAAEKIGIGVDGCSAPVFAMPLHHAALAFARLADPAGLPAGRASACRVITAAMTARPDMVAGEGRFDTALMRLGQGRIIAKGGAEGYQGIAVLPASGRPGLGIAIKVASGDLDGRGRPVIALEILRQLGVLSRAEIEQLSDFGPRPVTNWRGLEVGEIRPSFELERAAV